MHQHKLFHICKKRQLRTRLVVLEEQAALFCNNPVVKVPTWQVGDLKSCPSTTQEDALTSC